ncbi:MAG: hypothetical protein NC905_05445 [Candidatus Omnitrophica bacterium]|nr:hypothetical protein [Candidatus Omnitrophota bacterium]MCM8777687.1 hypothetical protein [Candidatus Omnitrophota bacterium]
MENSKKPLIIDLSGKAGAGKTYVKDNLIQHLSSKYRCIDFSSYILSVNDFITFIVSMPLNFLCSILFVFMFIPKGYKWLSACLRWWIKMQIMIMKSRTLNGDFVFIDEGLFRRISLLRMHSLRRAPFEKTPHFFRKNFLYPDITIFVTADYDTCEARRMERDKETGRFKLPGNKRKGILVVEDLKRDIVFAEKKGIVKVLRYYNEGEFNVSLIDEIKNILEY